MNEFPSRFSFRSRFRSDNHTVNNLENSANKGGRDKINSPQIANDRSLKRGKNFYRKFSGFDRGIYLDCSPSAQKHSLPMFSFLLIESIPLTTTFNPLPRWTLSLVNDNRAPRRPRVDRNRLLSRVSPSGLSLGKISPLSNGERLKGKRRLRRKASGAITRKIEILVLSWFRVSGKSGEAEYLGNGVRAFASRG